MLKNYALLVLIFVQAKGAAQQPLPPLPDSLRARDYDYLYDRIDQCADDPVTQSVYLRAFLLKARVEGNRPEIINGYKNYVYYSPESKKLTYADSMVSLAKAMKDNAQTGAAYLTKGIVYYGQKRHREALSNYLIANSYISHTTDRYLASKVKYNIAQIKYYLGFYHEAIALLQGPMDYLKAHDPRGYLNCLHSLSLCYNKTGDYGRAASCASKGIAFGKEHDIPEMHAYFTHALGINEYALRNYAAAITHMKAALPAIIAKKDFANETVAYFYIGKSYWAMGKQQSAVQYFLKVDKCLTDKKYIRPDLRENYELLISYYKSRGDLNRQLHYIAKLLKADKVIEENFKYLSGRVHKEYDTRELLDKKLQIEAALARRRYNDYLFTAVIVLLFGVLWYVAHRYRANTKIYRRKFEELMQGQQEQVLLIGENSSRAEAREINSEAQENLLKQLAKFEKDRRFLEDGWTLVKLAAAFDSNTKYLSKVIALSRGKKFTDYINDLKIDYLIALLKEDRTLLNYTNKALGEEVGFSSTQRFANAFYTRTGIPAIFFIEEMKKQNEAQKGTALDKEE